VSVLTNIKTNLQRKWFDVSTNSIRATAPIDKKPGDIRFVSLVCHRDLNRYLIAIKSVYQQIGAGDVVILDDGSLTEQDRSILNHHLVKPTYYALDDVPTGDCPSYICWSRLLLIAELCQDHYILQVDSDIVAQKPLPEALQAIEEQSAFILVNRQHPGRIALKDMGNWLDAQGWNNPNSLQLNAERAFARLPMADTDFYVRGSAAFVGFPKGCISKERIENFSRHIEKEVGPQWRQWGSEQTTTNYVIGNAQELRFLEYPAYVNQTPKIEVEQASLVHFFGTYRYYKNRYLRSAKAAINSLSTN